MKKILLLFLSVLLIQSVSYAKDYVEFNFPDDGWHLVASPDKQQNKKCYVPKNQTTENYNEMLVFVERKIKTEGITPSVIIQKQLGKDRNNYSDIVPEYITRDIDDTMITWCSPKKNTCAVKRAFKGTNGVIIVSYINKMPHYSQNMFGRWSNILSTVKVYKQTEQEKPNNIIDL